MDSARPSPGAQTAAGGAPSPPVRLGRWKEAPSLTTPQGMPSLLPASPYTSPRPGVFLFLQTQTLFPSLGQPCRSPDLSVAAFLAAGVQLKLSPPQRVPCLHPSPHPVSLFCDAVLPP